MRAVEPSIPHFLQHRAQLRHQHAERLLPGRRQRVAPEQLGELVARHRPAFLRGEVREQDAALAAREVLLIQACAVRLENKALRERDPDVQRGSFPGASDALARL